MFLYRFQAPNTLYQMRPTRGPKSIPTASYGTFYFRKIFGKLKSALSAQIKSKWLENRCSCYIKIRKIFAFQPFFKWGPGKKIDQVEPLFGFSNPTEPNPDTRKPILRFRFLDFQKVIFGRVATRLFGFFRKSAFFGGRCAKTKKSIWASHPSFSSPQIGLENGTKTSLAPSGTFRAFGPAKRTFQKNFKKSKKRTFSKKVGSQSGNPFLPKNSRFSAPFGPEKVQLSKKNFRPDFSTNHQVCSVEFGNPKSGSTWSIFFAGPHLKNGWKAKILLIFM